MLLLLLLLLLVLLLLSLLLLLLLWLLLWLNGLATQIRWLSHLYPQGMRHRLASRVARTATGPRLAGQFR